MEILTASSQLLVESGYETSFTSINGRRLLTFEDLTVFGFVFEYPDISSLINTWAEDEQQMIARHQFVLRRSGQKAWNTYVVLLTQSATDLAATVTLNAIEEDLGGTRKIARAAIHDVFDLRGALLALLHLQAAPKLEAVDISKEIRQRATELPGRAIDAFLSQADDTVVLQVLEEDP